ncbi:D-alanine--D-alanine ligase [Hazenella sp. IB182357]|uniref:D-alanine--D-alanine ligase n=1 Tax=Polycladospora coralii TaxID=2771432 RepID=A0A926N5I3_9BACL|nr:D-alanine--D-alanine ligase [Polycladospora coralii]MBD1371809.1 D-alanine--D-alanine ligase [Polycladospora coralii]
MTKKLRVAVLFGGKSGEHDVSLSSAASVIQAMDPEKYDVIPIGISKRGEWVKGASSIQMIAAHLNTEILERLQGSLPIASSEKKEIENGPTFSKEEVDVVFPVLHGTFGEDGTMQGLLEIADVPYVGAGVLASAVAMDKVIAKKLFAQTGIPQGAYMYFLKSEIIKNVEVVYAQIESTIGYPCFIKPANLGSSVGISKAENRTELQAALALAGKYDRKIIVEEFIPAREIEVAVLGNDDPKASVVGEIISSGDFYDYQAKYVDGESTMQIPADLPSQTQAQIQELAIRAYQALDCSGLSRVDFFVRKDNGEILINEINTMPGFTPYSMYAHLWAESGLSYKAVIAELIQLAITRYREKSELITTLDMN